MEPPSGRTAQALIEEATGWAHLAAQSAAAMGRDDLGRRVAAARARLLNPDTAIVVVGEFKQGKSSLVNGLLGIDICPVDDDIATSTLTILRHGEEPRVVAWHGGDGERAKHEYPLSDIRGLVTEHGNQGSGQPEFVEVFLPNSLLARGISIVDSPGANGIRPGHTAIVLGYLQAVHAAIFVTDASSPLTHEELAFLKEATRLSPATVVAQTKIDMFPHWRDVRDANIELLRRTGLAIEVVPLSSALRGQALERGDRELNEESGFAKLIQFLDDEVVQRSATIAVLGVLDATVASLEEMQITTQAGIQAREAPGTMQERIKALQESKERLDRLRQGNARWSTAMNDGLGDVVSQADHRFKRRMRDLQRQTDEEIAKQDPRTVWPELTARVRDLAAAASRDAIRDMESGTDEVARRITALLAEEDLMLESAVGTRREIDLSKYWAPKPLTTQSVAGGLGMGLSSLRGAQGGLILLGMLTGLAGIAVSTGVLVGVGAIFGGKQILEERKRQVTTRRQEAKTAIRQFVDETEFETGKALRELSRDLNRRLRDHYGERIAERLRTCADTAASLERGLQEDDAARKQRIAELREQAAQLDTIVGRLAMRRDELTGTGVTA